MKWEIGFSLEHFRNSVFITFLILNLYIYAYTFLSRFLACMLIFKPDVFLS